MEATLSAFLEFLLHEQNYSTNTIAAYRNDLSQFLSFIGNRDEPVTEWCNVGQGLIQAYIGHLRDREYASSTVARKVAALRSFFHYLHQEGHITTDPTVSLDSPRVRKRLPKSLDSRQMKVLLAAPARDGTPKSLRDRALLALLYATGMRASEVVSLSTSDADVERGMIQCESRRNQTRLLPLTAEARQALADYLEGGRPRLLKDAGQTALFLNHRGHRLTRQGLWLIIKVCARQAGLPADVTPHTLRHSFAAHRLDQGTDLREVQRLLGHANISTTYVYMQLATKVHEA